MLAVHKRATAKSVPEPSPLMVRGMVVVPEKLGVEDPNLRRPQLMVFHSSWSHFCVTRLLLFRYKHICFT